ncbi:hypothetical protein [Catenulispora rubra]|uniref:hypothetical protein n=1 Tax=Catenulispora rubra TaxID=280293 RepID=UPI00189256EA|nr:hypothetical protein [Catenulispora rubra]
MTFRRRLIPVAALVVAIGASAAGAATAAETGNGSSAKAQKGAGCKVELDSKTFKKEIAAKVAGKGQIVTKGGSGDALAACKKKVATVGLDPVAAKLGVSKDALVLALKQTERWVAGSATKPPVAQFEEHLAGLLHVPVSKVTSVFGSFTHAAVKPGA